MLLQVVTPLGAVARGLVAGLAGSAALTAFFGLTRRLAPASPEGAFEPPEPQQRSEQATETVARRVVEGLAARGPLSEGAKQTAGQAVHYGFGGGWGVLYGLTRESVPGFEGAACGAGFGAAVWLASDGALLPAFNLAGDPRRYPAGHHAYTLAAHVVYGLAVHGVYTALRPGPGRAGLVLGALGLLAALPGKPGRVARRTRGALRVGRALAR